MKKISKFILAGLLTLLSTTILAHSTMETVKIKVYGNREMCKARIEKAAFVKKTAEATWDDKTKMAVITYDPAKTNIDEILKRIAYAGHDNEKFAAPQEAYNKLPECCKYKRELVPNPVTTSAKDNSMNKEMSSDNSNDKQDMSKMEMKTADSTTQKRDMKPMATMTNEKTISPEFNLLLGDYLGIKNALTIDNGTLASSTAGKFLSSLKEIKMESLSPAEHTVWMQVMDKLKVNAGHIQETKDVKNQRIYFDVLSKDMYKLIKVFKTDKTVYQQLCPMYNGKGATWISEQSAIKNPYYGKAMQTCGNTTEVIKPKK